MAIPEQQSLVSTESAPRNIRAARVGQTRSDPWRNRNERSSKTDSAVLYVTACEGLQVASLPQKARAAGIGTSCLLPDT